MYEVFNLGGADLNLNNWFLFIISLTAFSSETAFLLAGADDWLEFCGHPELPERGLPDNRRIEHFCRFAIERGTIEIIAASSDSDLNKYNKAYKALREGLRLYVPRVLKHSLSHEKNFFNDHENFDRNVCILFLAEKEAIINNVFYERARGSEKMLDYLIKIACADAAYHAFFAECLRLVNNPKKENFNQEC